jgi:alpha-mannosidase
VTVELPVDAAGASVEAYDAEGRKLVADGAAGAVGASLLTLVPSVPAFGYKTIWLRTAEKTAELSDDDARRAEAAWLADGVWETEAYAVRFNERGEIVRLYDKAAGREVVMPGEAANRFCFFHDRPTLWDAWDIDDRYEEQSAGKAELLERAIVRRGRVADVLRFRWRIGRSEIEQDVVFRHADRRIDFETRVRWNEAHKLLKVAFPIDVLADKATYEIPFGALERPTHRNTSWEQAQFEVCGHRFADVSEFGYGVSLLNDCKYGYDIQGSTIRLSLLRAPKWPDDTADLGDHVFTYSLYPHAGDWRAAHTARRAAELNADPAFAQTGRRPGSLPPEGSLLPYAGGHVVLDTVKPAEDGSGTVLRFYESAGGRGTAEFGWPHSYGRAVLSNALEDEGEELARDGERIRLHFTPYEIKTVKLLPDE